MSDMSEVGLAHATQDARRIRPKKMSGIARNPPKIDVTKSFPDLSNSFSK
jgi:hypothetical protein